MAKLNSEEYTSNENIRNIREGGTENWFARELATVLEYANWQNFANVIDHAKLACKKEAMRLQTILLSPVKWSR